MQALPPNLSPLVKWRPPGCLQAFIIYPWGAPKPPGDRFPLSKDHRHRGALPPDPVARRAGPLGALERPRHPPEPHRALAYPPDSSLIRTKTCRCALSGRPTSTAATTSPIDNLPFRMSLNGHDRNELVHLTSNYYLSSLKGSYTPEPVEADQFILSTLGAWFKVSGGLACGGRDRNCRPKAAHDRAVDPPCFHGPRPVRAGGLRRLPLPLRAPGLAGQDHRAQVLLPG
jgi:hypothetical protein